MRGSNAGERFGDGCRMVREIVVHRDAVSNADHFQPAFDAGEQREPFGDPFGSETDLHRNGNCRRGVAYVVNADERQLERAERRTATTYVESRRAFDRLDVVRLPIDVLARAERLDARHRGRRQLARRGAVGADEQETTAWHEVDQPAKREPDGIEI